MAFFSERLVARFTEGPCAFQYCERAHEECNFLEEYKGFHGDLKDNLINVEGEYIHQRECHDCGEEIIYHHGVIYNDYGDEIYHGVACAECKYTFSDMPHGEHVITGAVEATCTEDGYTGDEICEDCGHVFKNGSVVKSLGHEYKNGVCIRCGQKQNIPVTGDESHMMTWLLIMAGALACIFLCGLRFRKIKK